MRRIFLDTNVLVDLVCHRDPFFQEAKKLFALAYTNKICIGISALSYINTVYIAKKYGFCTNEVIEILKKISSFTSITHLEEATIKDAMNCEWNDFEDAVQYHSSLPFSADYIITRNPKDFSKSNIPVYTPTDFLQIPYWIDEPDSTILNEPEIPYKKTTKKSN